MIKKFKCKFSWKQSGHHKKRDTIHCSNKYITWFLYQIFSLDDLIEKKAVSSRGSDIRFWINWILIPDVVVALWQRIPSKVAT